MHVFHAYILTDSIRRCLDISFDIYCKFDIIEIMKNISIHTGSESSSNGFEKALVKLRVGTGWSLIAIGFGGVALASIGLVGDIFGDDNSFFKHHDGLALLGSDIALMVGVLLSHENSEEMNHLKQ
jgi:hypothetical protein